MAGAAKLSFQLVLNPFFRLPESKPFVPQYCCFRAGPFKTLQKRRRSSHSLSRSPTFISFSLVEAEDKSLSFTDPETDLLEALLGIQGRGRAASPKQLKDVENAVQVLEDLKGVPEPTSSELIEGRWQLIFTTRPGTASPIQRTFVGVDFFKVFQEVYLKTDDQRVSNIVKFSDAIGELKVEAAATIKDGNRILFQFDRAAFSFKFLPFKVPYPVPFRLLGDEAKGWLDTTYLSHTGNIRISRGNKGTTFVLQKICEPRQRLLEAISTGFGIEEIVDELVSLRKKDDKGCDENLEGEWKLLWTSQLVDQNWEGIAADGLRGLQIVKKNGQLDNLVDVFPGLRYCASGHLVKTSERDTYSVTMSTGFAAVGGLKFTVEINNTYTLKLLYNDGKIRINRGNQDIMFVHLRVG